MTIGVVAELNPFHNGHQKFLNKIKEVYPNSTIVMVLSGHFCQRGIPSVLDKWTKTQIALNHGVDIVIELPFPFATQGADIFATGAIYLLKMMKIDVLAFGTESCDIEGLKALVDAEENENFNNLVQVFLRMGNNYPTALSKSLEELTHRKFTLPNDLLAISYLKAMKHLNASFQLLPIQREKNYHEKDITISYESASSIREAIRKNVSLKGYTEESVYKALQDHATLQDDYFPYLRYKILSSKNLEAYLGVDKGMAKKLKKQIVTCSCYDELIHLIHTKNHTYNYLSRMLLHILVGFTKEEARKYDTPHYLRLLGFSKRGQKYLNKMKKDCPIPIISKFKKEYQEWLQLECKATSIYALSFSHEKGYKILQKEFQMAPIRKEEDK